MAGASVGIYDPAAFLATRQFASDWSSQGIPARSILMWQRDFPEVTQLVAIPAGVVAVTFNTNTTAAATTVTLEGTPAAPRITWHKTDTNTVQNVFGLSLQQGASISPWDYLEGFAGIGAASELYTLAGTDTSAPTLVAVETGDEYGDGAAFFASSTIQSDWSGVLNVSPMTGLDFGDSETRATLAIRNDGATARTVAVNLATDSAWGDVALQRASVHFRDSAVARTNAVWHTCPSSASESVAVKLLAPGETWNLEFGIDRTQFQTNAQGLEFGALLSVTDVDGASKMRADIPLRGVTSGGRLAATVWQAGLWVADVAFDKIIVPGSELETDTGGTAKLRLPVHIDSHGEVRLLQRVLLAGETDANGVFHYMIYAGDAEIPNSARLVTRISAVCLPTEIPVVKSINADLAAGTMAFDFTVAEGGSTSLLRHPLHPSHDGLRWNFEDPAPSGDNLENYKYDVKPELFSVQNHIELALDMDGGEAAWNPEETKTGTCRWSFGNLMRQGDITLIGTTTLKRISTEAEIVLE